MLPNIVADIERGITLQQVLEHFGSREAKEQTEAARTRYFCPFKRCAGDRHPHFVVEHEKRVDGYGKVVRIDQHINKGAVVMIHWRCDHSRVDGYGVISLVSAILGFPPRRELLSRNKWVSVIGVCADIMGLPAKELQKESRNGFLLQWQAQDRWDIRISDSFTPEAMTALSLDEMTGVSANDIVSMLHAHFGLWQVEKYTMAGCYPNGERSEASFKSYERRAHALFPIFAFCYEFETGEPITENPERRGDKWVARIVMPAFVRSKDEDFDWRYDFWTVFNSSDVSADLHEFKQNCVLFGDAAAMDVVRTRRADIVAERIGETIEKDREIEVDDPDHKGKTMIDIVPLMPDEMRLQKCVLCRCPLDGVSVYLWLNYPRLRFTKNGVCSSNYYRNEYWHVAWLRGDDMLLNPFEDMALSSIAKDTFELFGNDRNEISMANTNALRYNYLRLCMLPTSMGEMDQVDSGFGKKHVPHSPLDYFRYYQLTADDQNRNMLIVGSTDGIKAMKLQKELNGSSALRPFTIVEKKKKAGKKAYNYEINLTAAWQMMSNKGYCRSIKPGSRNTIGQCYRIDGHFVYELDPASVMADMRQSLEDYAKDNAHGDVEDVEMMMNAMLRCKDLQYDKNITKLPLMAMPKSESYGPELDYFFFRNCALEITPSRITPRSYDDLDFLVYRSQVLPFDYQQPFYGTSPISIKLNEQYKEMKKAYDDARRVGDKNSSELFAMKQELDDYAAVSQWDVSIAPTEEYDEDIIVPSSIRNDNKHNEWLRWWPFLRLLRCFANEDWKREEDGQFSDADRKSLSARMANLMFTLGRCVYRYHGSAQYIPYFLENNVSKEGKAQGGSGKSMLLNSFVRCVRNVCKVDAKNMSVGDDIAKHFAGFVLHYHDVIHIEDFPKCAIDPLFNYASSGFVYKVMYEDKHEVSREEAPNVVITSNFVVQSIDESALGRVQFGGMSHYFSRDIPVLNKAGRGLDTIVPGIRFSESPEDYPIEFRSQVIYTLAKCLQFCMVAMEMNTRVSVPGADLLERLSRTELGDTFYDWFTEFLSRPYVYNVPISINEIFNEYRRYYDPSKARYDSVSRTKFYEGLQKYCAKPAHGVVFMPIKRFLSPSDTNRSRGRSIDGSEKSYLRKGSSWLTRTFIDEQGKVHRARVLSKNAGDGSVTGGAVWFSKRGTEPKDGDEMRSMIDAFMSAPDPEPILDENENPITEAQYSQWQMLNTEEDAEVIRKAGGMRRVMQTVTAQPPEPIATGEARINEDLPF